MPVRMAPLLAQGSVSFRPAYLHLGAPRISPEAPVGDLSPQLLQWLPSEPTIPRTGLAPAPSRPRRSLRKLTLSSLQISFRAALPGRSRILFRGTTLWYRQ